MEKIVATFLILLSVLTFTKNYIQTDQNELNKIVNLEQTIGMAFNIPDSLIFADPNVIYPILLKQATEQNANVFRASINNKPDNEVEVIKYVLLTGTTEMYDYVHVSSGKPLTSKDMADNRHYLSSLPKEDPNRTGLIKDFGNNNLISAYPMLTAYQHLPVAGTYYLETKDPKVFQKFIDGFSKDVNIHYQTTLTMENFTNQSPVPYRLGMTGSTSLLTNIQYLVVLVILLLTVYSVFHHSHTIGIYKLHGISTIRIWLTIAGRSLFIALALSVIFALPACLFTPNADQGFIWTTFQSILVAYGIILLISIVPYIYLLKLPIQQLIKNKQNTTLILIINTLAKIGCSVLLLITANHTVHQYMNITEEQANLKGWEQNKDYGVFYPVYAGYDEEDFIKGWKNFFTVTANKLYPILNKTGSLFINTRQYEETALFLNRDYKGIRSITVNNNYFLQYPVFDVNHKPIHIREEETQRVLLIPEKYRDRKSELVNFFNINLEALADNQEKFYKLDVPEPLKQPQIRIIWIADDQEIFSFNPDVFPAEKYIIAHPIIQVVTVSNSFMSEREGILGNGGTDPLKVKLVNRDTAATYQALLPELRRLKLDDNLKTIVTVNEYMLLKVNQLKEEIRLNLLLLAGLLVGFIFLMIQFVLVMYSRYQKTFVVRKLHGLSFGRTYKEFMLLLSGLWIAQAGLVPLLIRPDYSTALILGGVAVLEFIICIITLNLFEQKNIARMSKGGLL